MGKGLIAALVAGGLLVAAGVFGAGYWWSNYQKEGAVSSADEKSAKPAVDCGGSPSAAGTQSASTEVDRAQSVYEPSYPKEGNNGWVIADYPGQPRIPSVIYEDVDDPMAVLEMVVVEDPVSGRCRRVYVKREKVNAVTRCPTREESEEEAEEEAEESAEESSEESSEEESDDSDAGEEEASDEETTESPPAATDGSDGSSPPAIEPPNDAEEETSPPAEDESAPPEQELTQDAT